MWRKNTLITLARLSARILRTSCHLAPRFVSQRSWQGFFISISWVRALACTPVTLAMSYLSTGLAGCSVDPVISCGTRKLARTPRVTKKKKKEPAPISYQSKIKKKLIIRLKVNVLFIKIINLTKKKTRLKREQFLLWFGALLIRQHLIIVI